MNRDAFDKGLKTRREVLGSEYVDASIKNADDFTMDFDGVPLLVDSMSSQYLQGATVDYKEDLMGAEFKIINPNAQTSCGCGSSFSV